MKATEVAKICKALGEVKRLLIIQRLTDGEKCACDLLEQFEISQPTLSHHMRVLSECNLVNTRKDGKWSYYSLNCNTLSAYREYIGNLVCNRNSGKADCCGKK